MDMGMRKAFDGDNQRGETGMLHTHVSRRPAG